MATKQTKKKKTTKKTPLLARNRFNLPTLIALVGVLSVVGYYVLTTFAAGPTRLSSANCQAPAPGNTAAYDCYQGTAEGWATKMFLVMLSRNPDPSGYTYWSNQVNTKGVSAAANGFIASAGAKTVFSTTNHGAKVDALYQLSLGRPADPSGKTYWTDQFKTKSSGEVFTAFMSVASVKTYSNAALRDKILNYMKPGWNATAPVCNTCGCPGKPPCEEPVEPEIPPIIEEPPAETPNLSESPEYSFIIPDDGSIDGGTDALPSLGEVSLDDLSGASEDDINKIIEEKTQSSGDGVGSEAAARSYGGKLKILPPEEAIANGANEMRYYINGKLKATVKKAPYAYTLDSTRMKNGRYVLSIAAYQDGEKLDEYSYVLSVKNSLTFWQKIYNLISAPFAK